jgi:predicted DNA-binding protein
MPKRDKNEVKTDWFKFRCATSFKERLEAAAKRESRTMSNLIVLIMTKYCEQQEALYMQPKATKPNNRKGNPGRYENAAGDIV